MRLPDNSLLTDRSLYTRELQEFLRKLAFYYSDIPLVVPDGIFGPATTRAVAAFQRHFGLPVTGQVNFSTWQRVVLEYRRLLAEESLPIPLDLFPDKNAVLRQGDTGDAVFALQLMLNALAGRYANLSTVPISGTMDQETLRAVTALQQIGNLPSSGEVDKETWNYIAALYNAL